MWVTGVFDDTAGSSVDSVGYIHHCRQYCRLFTPLSAGIYSLASSKKKGLVVKLPTLVLKLQWLKSQTMIRAALGCWVMQMTWRVPTNAPFLDRFISFRIKGGWSLSQYMVEGQSRHLDELASLLPFSFNQYPLCFGGLELRTLSPVPRLNRCF